MPDPLGMPSHLRIGPGVEFDLIRRMLDVWGERARQVGDDAAVLDVPAGERVVVSTDTSIEGVHFRREWHTPREIGYRATTAALSDLAAMAARPRGVLLALGLPTECRSELDQLALGVGDAAAASGVPIVGGDLSLAHELSLAVTVVGSTARPVTRTGAHVGHSIFATGVFGGPLVALRAWADGARPSPWSRARFTHPVARIAEALWLADHGASAMIDVSDGLSSELRHLAAASGVEMHVDVDRVLCATECTWRDAMASGEEYELIVCAPDNTDVDAFARTFLVPLTRIGRVQAGAAGTVVATWNGERVDVAFGHDHFSG